MNAIPTLHVGKRISSENISTTQNMADKNIYLDMMNELIVTKVENHITIDHVKDNRYTVSRRRKASSSAKKTTLQSFFDRETQENRLHQNSIASDDKCDKMSDEDDEDDDDYNEFYEDDQDTVSSMLPNFNYQTSPFSGTDVGRHFGKATSDNNSEKNDSSNLYRSPKKCYTVSPSKPKYNRNWMDAKQVDALSMSLHTSDGTEVTATETDYSWSGSSHHSPVATLSPYQNRLHYSSMKDDIQTECQPPVTVYERSIIDKAVTLLDADVPDISALQTYRLLGEGYFGKVYLVKDPNDASGTFLALKTISKYHLICDDQVHTVMREKEILQLCSHPNIANLLATKQDASSLYILQSFIPGGDLFHMIHHLASVDFEATPTTYPCHPVLSDETNVQFYVACIADALWYLHCGLSYATDITNRSVVYRDLKQENIMINERGYPILIDFGCAKILEVSSLHDETEGNGSESSTTLTRTYTMCGTAKYVSPEIIEGIGHTCSTDYWSLGVLVYELLTCGREHPFEYTPNIDDLSLYRSIVEADYIPLPDEISADGNDFVDKLLSKDLMSRLGSTESRADNPILLHPWLQKWDVSLLRQQSYPAPWLPTLQNPLFPTTNEGLSHGDEILNHNDEVEELLTFDMDQQTDPNLTMKEQAMFADF
jgi:protein kinase A